MAIYFISDRIPPKSVVEFQFLGPAQIRVMSPHEQEFHILLEKMKNICDEDEWWLRKRLGGSLDIHDSRGKLSDKQISTYLEVFHSVFDNSWWCSVCRYRKRGLALDPLGFFGVQAPLFRILRLGECIKVLGGLSALPPQLIRRLRNPSQYWQTATELEIACCFKQAGFDVEMYPMITSKSHPDGKITIGEQIIYYEVTEQSWSVLNKEVFKAEGLLIDWVSRKLGVVNGHIRFLLGRDKPLIAAKHAIQIMEEQASKREPSLNIKTDFFEATFGKGQGIGGWLSISGLEPEPSQIVQRWIRRIFDEAKQLPAGEAGVIIGSPLFLWGFQEVNSAHSALVEELKRQPHTRISGVIFTAKHIENSGFIKHVPSIIINLKAKIRCDKVISKMAQALFTYPDWM